MLKSQQNLPTNFDKAVMQSMGGSINPNYNEQVKDISNWEQQEK